MSTRHSGQWRPGDNLTLMWTQWKKKIKKTQHEELRVICDPSPLRESWGCCDISSFRFLKLNVHFLRKWGLRSDHGEARDKGMLLCPLLPLAEWAGTPTPTLGVTCCGWHQGPQMTVWRGATRGLDSLPGLLREKEIYLSSLSYWMGMSVGWSLNYHTYPN